MARRRLTVKRIDPWSVLKFGFLANIVLLIIFMMIMGVVWFIIDRLQIVDQVCGIATDVGFTQCGINAPNLFRSMILLGLLWIVVQTAVLVFLAFLYNLISDLVGGIGMTIIDDTTPTATPTTSANARQVTTAGHQPVGARNSGRPSASVASAERASARGHDDGTAQQPTVSPDSSARTTTRARDNTTDDDLFSDR